MAQIYEQHFWGGNAYDFYSGEGSHNSTIVSPYTKAVTAFLKAHNNTLSVCDLGCGDFNIGKQLLPFTSSYIAVDIVADLIERNNAKFKAKHLEFQCLDISKDRLPKADVAILRQVLQHLSNAEILEILKPLSNYKYLILTEHIPNGNFTPNKDKIASLGIRLKQQSGVDILKPPFSIKVKTHEVINEVVFDDKKGRIVTTLFRM